IRKDFIEVEACRGGTRERADHAYRVGHVDRERAGAGGEGHSRVLVVLYAGQSHFQLEIPVQPAGVSSHGHGVGYDGYFPIHLAEGRREAPGEGRRNGLNSSILTRRNPGTSTSPGAGGFAASAPRPVFRIPHL